MSDADPLVAFLRARLDEDEHWAHMVEAGWPPRDVTVVAENPERYALMPTEITPSKATFILRNDPARVLREVEAKRAILAEHEKAQHETGRLLAAGLGEPEDATTWRLALEMVTGQLAAVYSDHPDYERVVTLG